MRFLLGIAAKRQRNFRKQVIIGRNRTIMALDYKNPWLSDGRRNNIAHADTVISMAGFCTLHRFAEDPMTRIPNDTRHVPQGRLLRLPHRKSVQSICRLRLAILITALFLANSRVTLGLAAEPGLWRASVEKVKITPADPVWMAGYAARSGPSDGVLLDLHARVLALFDQQEHRLVIITMDLIEIPDSLRAAILKMALTQHGLQPHELLLNVSHTHGGPMVSAKTVADWGIEPEWGSRAESFVNGLVDKLDTALKNVLSHLEPVTLGYSHARCGFAMNRRLPSGGAFQLAPNPDGPVDHDVPVLRIESAEKGLIGIVFGYACHNTALGPTLQLNGDYAGFALQKLENDHPGTVALFLMGCGGDQDPAPRRHLADAQQNGLTLATAVEAALVPAPVSLSPILSAKLEMCPIPFAPLPPKEELEARANSPDGFVSRHARWVLEQWGNTGEQPPDYQLPVHVMEFGQKLTLVALGGEPVADYSLRLKLELSTEDRLVWVAGYSNLVNAYVPNRRVLLEGGYEGTQAVIYQSLPGPFQLDVEARIISLVLRLAEQVRETGG